MCCAKVSRNLLDLTFACHKKCTSRKAKKENKTGKGKQQQGKKLRPKCNGTLDRHPCSALQSTFLCEGSVHLLHVAVARICFNKTFAQNLMKCCQAEPAASACMSVPEGAGGRGAKAKHVRYMSLFLSAHI